MLKQIQLSLPFKFSLLALLATALTLAVLSSQPSSAANFAKPPTKTPTPTGPTPTPTRTHTPTVQPPTPTNAATSPACPTIVNMALNKSYTSSVAASGSYPDTGGTELTNGVYGGNFADPAWQGRTGNYFQTVDLGQNCLVGVYLINFLQDTGAGIFYPDRVVFSFSTNGTNFTALPDAIRQGSSGQYKATANPEVTVRYVRVTITDPAGWIFEDELEAQHLPTPTPTGPTPTPTNTATPNVNVWEGSFIQPWLTNGWTSTQWSTELQYMKNVKMDHIIWQWTVDSLPSRMWTYYPTTMAGFTQTNSNDAVGISLQQAQIKGMKVWLGLNWTDDWWNHYANDNTWLTNEFNISKNVAQELWNLYGGQYGNTIAGFYMTMEMDNVNFQTATTQNRMIAVYNDTANYIHTHTGKPVMVAPFFNETYPGSQNATQYATMWGTIVAGAPLDVVAVQDGIGVGHATVATIASWLSPMGTAINNARPATQFWVDLETLDPDFTPAQVSRVIQQIEAEKAYVDKVTTFSFNHYDSPMQGHTTEYNAWKAYTDVH